ncbi:hypothetical protein CDCA_CDCA02G0666 [Cyanidium caldarium]|uniref:AMP-dependent synthetase/ligase domain-containing protein n=1 Tax=Cyanidium caldarium TaxID=2771 RepID=A0AAV9IRE1_CYACA|nr:hypothetical protein CDCA_CDCA02G0666 [Cyanidium caldarium]
MADAAETSPAEGTVIWEPSPLPDSHPLLQFTRRFGEATGDAELANATQPLPYERLHRQSVRCMESCYRTLIEVSGMRVRPPPHTPTGSFPVTNREVDGAERVGNMPITGLRWLPGCTVNVAENLLRHPGASLVSLAEPASGIPRRVLPYPQLRRAVRQVAEMLRDVYSVRPGDHVAGYLPNTAETVVAFLATATLGAVWASCSPEFGVQAALDRFRPLRPRALIAADVYVFKARRFDYLDKAFAVAAALDDEKAVPLLVVPHGQSAAELEPQLHGRPARCFPALYDAAADSETTDDTTQQPPFHYIRFDRDPVVTMFSSGTTGRPKCMAQGAGILLTQEKEHLLHCNLNADSVLFFYTTCSWMMWNWSVAALARGCRLVLYDGAPMLSGDGSGGDRALPPDDGLPGTADILWHIVRRERVTHFGCGAKYLQMQEQLRVRPPPLPHLQTVLVTGSPSTAANFLYVHRAAGAHVQYCSISGGTDINGCFALGIPCRAVRVGELQAPGLAMDVQVLDERGQPVCNADGELVCRNAVPSMPLFFWHDDAHMSRYRASYFARFGECVWQHGDFARLVVRPGAAGEDEERSLVIRGRSDATLNPGGVRIGSAEIYAALEAVPEVEDALAVSQAWHDDVRVVLFIKLAGSTPSTGECDAALQQRLREQIRRQVSPRHVPQRILAVPAIPYTPNMKKMEVAVKRILDGEPVPNSDACADPTVLEWYREVARRLQQEKRNR